MRWTRTQRIRTTASIPVDVAILDGAALPVYLRISEKAKHLRELGMSDRPIVGALGVTDKIVSKAIAALSDKPSREHQI